MTAEKDRLLPSGDGSEVRYAPVQLRTQATPAFTCLDCGAVVLDQEIHDRWHHDLADGVVAVYTEALVDAINAHTRSLPPSHLSTVGGS